MTQYCSILGILWILWIIIFYPSGRFASNCIAKITGFGGCVLTGIDFLSYLFIYARSRLTVESVLCLALISTIGPETAFDSDLFSLFPPFSSPNSHLKVFVIVMFLVLLSICLGTALAWMIVTILRNRATVLMLQKRLPNFKVVPAIPVFGSTYHFKDLSAEGLFTTFIGLHNLYGKTLITQSLFNFPSLHVCDAKVIAQIMQARTVESCMVSV